MEHAFFLALQQSALAHAVAHSNHLVGAGLQIVHVIGLILLLASVVLLNLRANGLGLRQQAAGPVVHETARLLWTGLALAGASGTLIFLSSAVRYVDNAAFDWKVVLLGTALVLQIAADRGLRTVEAGSAASLRGKALAAGAALAWLGVASAGRAIGYI
jgi:hypothetical protein